MLLKIYGMKISKLLNQSHQENKISKSGIVLNSVYSCMYKCCVHN